MKIQLVLEDYEKLLFDKLMSDITFGSNEEIASTAKDLYAEIYGVKRENLNENS